jgi:hypothetical protein
MIHRFNNRVTFRESVALLVAFIVAELFYKFHSFALECAAFLCTWYILGAIGAALETYIMPKKERVS